MTLYECIILGIVEGITEFLPVSSTGHMILAGHMLKMAQTEFLKSFEISIQLGAILAVVVLYGRLLLQNQEVLKRVITAFIPTALIGFIFYKLIKTYLLGNALVVVASLFIGGIILILFELNHTEQETSIAEMEQISYGQAALIGLFQAIAMIPGVSRSAATIIGGLALGLKRKTIVEFSFVLAVPTMIAATALDLLKSGCAFNAQQYVLLFIGGFISFVVAVLSIKFLLSYIKRHTFVSFGIYRMIIAVVFLLFSQFYF